MKTEEDFIKAVKNLEEIALDLKIDIAMIAYLESSNNIKLMRVGNNIKLIGLSSILSLHIEKDTTEMFDGI